MIRPRQYTISLTVESVLAIGSLLELAAALHGIFFLKLYYSFARKPLDINSSRRDIVYVA